jgi:hypothetical protein
MNPIKSLLPFLALATAAIFVSACSATKLPAPDSPTTAPVSYDGTFTNGGGATLVISSYVAAKGFDFAIKIQTEDACDSVDYKGSVEFTDPTTARNEDEDLFRLKPGTVHFEPALSMIGMDCARVLHVDFQPQK